MPRSLKVLVTGRPNGNSPPIRPPLGLLSLILIRTSETWLLWACGVAALGVYNFQEPNATSHNPVRRQSGRPLDVRRGRGTAAYSDHRPGLLPLKDSRHSSAR